MTLTRRAALAGTLSGLLPSAGRADTFCADADVTTPAPRRPTPLGAVNGRVLWGVAVGAPGLGDERLKSLIVAEQPKVVAIANGLKFDHLYDRPPEPGADLRTVANWRDCDNVLTFARGLGVPVRGDCLSWNDWIPPWLTALAENGGRERARDLLRQHFEGVFAHLALQENPTDAPTLAWCGVVNEPFDPWATRSGPPAWRKGAWLTAFGVEPDGVPGYIHSAFALADRFARPRTKLFLNETYCDTDRFGPRLRPAVLDTIDKLQRAGRRVDAIGLECHLMPQWMDDPANPDWRPFVAFCDDIGRRGVEVYLTELDVLDCSVRDVTDRDRLVAETMRSFVSSVLRSSAVKMITNWDLSDAYSWLRESAVYRSLPKWANCVWTPPCPRPTPYDAAMNPKRARDALADALAEAR